MEVIDQRELNICLLFDAICLDIDNFSPLCFSLLLMRYRKCLGFISCTHRICFVEWTIVIPRAIFSPRSISVTMDMKYEALPQFASRVCSPIWIWMRNQIYRNPGTHLLVFRNIITCYPHDLMLFVQPWGCIYQHFAMYDEYCVLSWQMRRWPRK